MRVLENSFICIKQLLQTMTRKTNVWESPDQTKDVIIFVFVESLYTDIIRSTRLQILYTDFWCNCTREIDIFGLQRKLAGHVALGACIRPFCTFVPVLALSRVPRYHHKYINNKL